MPEELDHARVPVPPPLIFVGYLAAALLLNWAMPLSAPWPAIFRLLGGLAIVAGVSLVGGAFSQLVKQQTTIDPRGPTTALVGGGPYQFTRNPVYLGFLLIYLGLTFLAGTLWGLILSPFLIWTVTRVVIQPEEAYMATKFKDTYAEYRSRVRRWI
jgi:protein-S-isoprenylcysteine O-methyltransferase Ste14